MMLKYKKIDRSFVYCLQPLNYSTQVETVATVISSISYANSTGSEQLTEKLELEYVVEVRSEWEMKIDT